MRTYRWLVIILIVVVVAIWIDLPNNPGIHVGGINRDIDTRLGLDLVGGVQALLEADLPEGTAVDAEKMRTATRIVENRVRFPTILPSGTDDRTRQRAAAAHLHGRLSDGHDAACKRSP